ncbi:MAG: purine-nucleoside phosphorylase [Thermovirgaceae bacterium]|nr:purine-nucleoside phosphorylase [Thermovirgaceae bacterium]
MSYREKVQKAKEFIINRIRQRPEAAVVLGSGLGAFAGSIQEKVEIPYEEIPGWPSSTAPGHLGKLVSGIFGSTPVIVMQGRHHYYEGYSLPDVVFPVRVFGEMKIPYYFATNASGGISHSLSPGDLVLIYDHINFQGHNPLRGGNEDEWGPRFPDMTYAYDRKLIELTESAASSLNMQVKRGVYAAFTGPSFETPAEIRMLRILGADVVGMSTVPEVIAARHMGMKICVISCVANYAAGMTEAPLTHEEVLKEMDKASGRLVGLLQAVILRLRNAGS